MFISFIYSNVCGFDSFIHIVKKRKRPDGLTVTIAVTTITTSKIRTRKKKLKKDESEYLRLILK